MPQGPQEYSTLTLVEGDAKTLILNEEYKTGIDRATSLAGLKFVLQKLSDSMDSSDSKLLGLHMELSMRISIIETVENALSGLNPSNVTYINPSTNKAVVIPNNLEQLEAVMGVMQFVYKDEFSNKPVVYTNASVIDNDSFFIKLKSLIKSISNERKRQGRELDIDLTERYSVKQEGGA